MLIEHLRLYAGQLAKLAPPGPDMGPEHITFLLPYDPEGMMQDMVNILELADSDARAGLRIWVIGWSRAYQLYALAAFYDVDAIENGLEPGLRAELAAMGEHELFDLVQLFWQFDLDIEERSREAFGDDICDAILRAEDAVSGLFVPALRRIVSAPRETPEDIAELVRRVVALVPQYLIEHTFREGGATPVENAFQWAMEALEGAGEGEQDESRWREDLEGHVLDLLGVDDDASEGAFKCLNFLQGTRTGRRNGVSGHGGRDLRGNGQACEATPGREVACSRS